jgi:hypothetical protein
VLGGISLWMRGFVCRCGDRQMRISSPPESAESWAEEMEEVAALMCWKRFRPTAMRTATLEKGWRCTLLVMGMFRYAAWKLTDFENVINDTVVRSFEYCCKLLTEYQCLHSRLRIIFDSCSIETSQLCQHFYSHAIGNFYWG